MRTAKKIILLALYACFLQTIQAQIVDKIEARVAGSKIQVSCTLQTSLLVDMSLFWSDDGGLSFHPCLTVNGDLTNQSSGRKVIVWDCGQDGIIMGSFIFKITSLPAANPQAVTPVVEPAEKKNVLRQPWGYFIPLQDLREKEEDSVIKNLPVTPTRTTDTSPNRDTNYVISNYEAPHKKSRFLLMPGIAVGNSLSYSLSAGYMKGNSGVFAKVKSNFATTAGKQMGEQNNSFYVEGFSKKGRFSVSAGMIGQVTDILFAQANIGYGLKWTEWKTISGTLVVINYSGGIDTELGLILAIDKFLIGAGASALIGQKTAIEANISIGLIF